MWMSVKEDVGIRIIGVGKGQILGRTVDLDTGLVVGDLLPRDSVLLQSMDRTHHSPSEYKERRRRPEAAED